MLPTSKPFQIGSDFPFPLPSVSPKNLYVRRQTHNLHLGPNQILLPLFHDVRLFYCSSFRISTLSSTVDPLYFRRRVVCLPSAPLHPLYPVRIVLESYSKIGVTEPFGTVTEFGTGTEVYGKTRVSKNRTPRRLTEERNIVQLYFS